MGSSSVTGDETIGFFDNMSFDGTARGGKMTTNGQLWIGQTTSDRSNNGGHVKLGQIISPDSTVTIGYSSPNITVTVAHASKFTKFTTSGTWVKDSRTTYIKVLGFAGGAGGGSGRRGLAGSNRGGGGGGASNGFFVIEGPANVFGGTETVTVGASANGGAAVTVDSTDGNLGGASNTTAFGNAQTVTTSSSRGVGGTTSGGSGGSTSGVTTLAQYFVWSPTSNVNGNAGSTGTPGVPTDYPQTNGDQTGTQLYPGPGGGGGGISNTDVVGNGSRAASMLARATAGDIIINNGGIAGTSGAPGGAGNPGLTSGGIPTAGTGGGGGGASKTAAAGAGGDGGIPGGAGGGGGASLNGFASGKGGNGARGEVWVMEWF